MSQFKVNINNSYEWFVAFYAWVLFYPFFVWQVPPSLIFVISLLLFAPKLIDLQKTKASDGIFIIIMSVLYLVLLARSGGTGQVSVPGKIAGLVPIILFYTSPKFAKAIFEKFTTLFAFLIIPSIFMYVLVVIFEISIPYRIIPPLNEIKDGVYRQYPFLVIYQGVVFFDRFCGYFDEPGVVGTICAVLLAIRNFNLTNWISISIFIAGVLSTSMFFFGISIMFLIYKVPLRYKLAIIGLVGVLVFVLYNNEIIYHLVFRRFSLTDDGTLAGINREGGSFAEWYEQFRHSEHYLWGLGRGFGALHNPGGASFRQLIVDYGLIFFITYILSFSLYSLKRIGFNNNWVVYMMLLLGIIFQRPFILNIPYVMLLLFPIYMLSSEKDKCLQKKAFHVDDTDEEESISIDKLV